MKFMQGKSEQLFQVETCRAGAGCPHSNLEAAALAAAVEGIFSRLEFSRRLRERLGEGPVLFHHIFRVSLSGCPNACSRPQIADFGLVGQVEPLLHAEVCTGCGLCAAACRESALAMEEGLPVVDRECCLLCGDCIRACTPGALRAGRKGLSILIGGRLGRRPRLAERLMDLATPEEALHRLMDLLELYGESARPGERFGAFLDRSGISEQRGG